MYQRIGKLQRQMRSRFR